MQTQAWYQNSLFCAILVLCYPCWHIWCFVSVLSKVLELCRCLTCSLTHDGQCCCADHLVQGQLADRRHQPDPLVPDLQWQSHSSTTHGEPTSALPLPLSHCLPPRSCQSMQLPGQSDSSVSGGGLVSLAPRSMSLRRVEDVKQAAARKLSLPLHTCSCTNATSIGDE